MNWKEEFISLMKRIAKSKDNIALLMLGFFPVLFLVDAVILLIKFGLNKIGFDCIIFDFFIKFLLMVSPLIPTMRIWSWRDDFGKPDGGTDGIIDICIGIWFIMIILACVI